MSKIKIPRLEYHVTNSCNLSCEGCSHYTNILKGHTKDPEDLDVNLGAWSKILEIPEFNLLGGEPFINKKLLSFCEVARKHLEDCNIVIYTNGLLLEKIPDVDFYGSVLAKYNIQIQLTYHSLNSEYRQSIQKNIDILKSWTKNYKIKITYKDGVTSWTKRYKNNEDGTISPFDHKDPDKSWEICTCKYCPMLIEDKIYKCAPIAYLPYMKSVNKTSPEFDQYLNYQPISHKDSIEKINAFFNKNFQPEDICNMCPSKAIRIKNKKI